MDADHPPRDTRRSLHANCACMPHPVLRWDHHTTILRNTRHVEPAGSIDGTDYRRVIRPTPADPTGQRAQGKHGHDVLLLPHPVAVDADHDLADAHHAIDVGIIVIVAQLCGADPAFGDDATMSGAGDGEVERELDRQYFLQFRISASIVSARTLRSG